MALEGIEQVERTTNWILILLIILLLLESCALFTGAST